MALAYLLDENLRGRLWQAIQNHNRRLIYPLDVVRVGEPPDLPLGSDDPLILTWAARESRLLVSLDESTIPKHLAALLLAGQHSPGVLFVRSNPLVSIQEIVEWLALIAHATEPHEWIDRIGHIP
jgi:hypothetical protein